MNLLTDNEYIVKCTNSATAKKYGIDNTPSGDIVAALLLVKKNIYDPLCIAYNTIIPISSGYRCKELNTKIGGSKTSDHMFGRALDLDMDDIGLNNNELFDRIRKTLQFKQMIKEFGTEESPAWVHVAWEEDNLKNECLRALTINKKTVYSKI